MAVSPGAGRVAVTGPRPFIRPVRHPDGARPLRRASARLGPGAGLVLRLLLLLALGLAAAPALAPAPVAAQTVAAQTGEALRETLEAATDPGGGPAAAVGAPAAAPLSLEADAAEVDRRLRAWDEAARQAEDVIARGAASTGAYDQLRRSLAAHRDAARAMADRAAEALRPLQAQFDALSAPVPAEGEAAPAGGGVTMSPGVARQRRALDQRIGKLEEIKLRSEQALTRAESLIGGIDALLRRRFMEQLATLGPSPATPAAWEAAALETLRVLREVGREVAERLADPAAAADRQARLPLTLGLIVGGLGLMGWTLRRSERALRARLAQGVTRSGRAAYGAGATLARLALPVIAALLLRLGLGETGLFGPTGETLLNHALGGVMALGAARGLALAFYAPREPELRLSSLDDEAAANAALRAQGLGLALMLDLMLVRAGEEVGLSAGALAAFNLIAVSLGAASLWMLARSIGPRPAPPPEPDADDPLAEPQETSESLGRRLAWIGAFLLRLAAAGSLVLAIAGYYAAAQFMFRPLALSLGLICACVLLQSLLRNFVEAYLERHAAEASGLRLLLAFSGFAITLAAFPLLAFIWGARRAELEELWRFVVVGIEVGGVHVSPGGFISFAVVFGLAFGATRLAQMIMSTSVLPNTRLDAGARSAVTASMGYLGFILAALAGTAAAGIDLSSLAIVFGALSVGIGFGLQTIFSNFVSGVILMLERPIKVGDWIFVGGDHGIVKRISVRATEIETFDKSSLILPNSQLIEGKVVNYTHSNSAGRLIVRVTVAHGSDLRAAHAILLEIARADRRVLRYPAPQALIASFAESGVNLELRVILRDVLTIFDVQTDFYLAVYERFRAAGLVIPLPQRVLRLAEPARIAEALRGAQAGRDALDWPETAPETGSEETPPAPASAPAPKRRSARKPGPTGESPAANEAPAGGVPSADQAGRDLPEP
ncbi:MAG: DUF3772 domain-containing protein [Pseudomonadota bacterium]|nr:DUF3772 domain-containing protein [Pseudomonadota bacterium]